MRDGETRDIAGINDAAFVRREMEANRLRQRAAGVEDARLHPGGHTNT